MPRALGMYMLCSAVMRLLLKGGGNGQSWDALAYETKYCLLTVFHHDYSIFLPSHTFSA